MANNAKWAKNVFFSTSHVYYIKKRERVIYYYLISKKRVNNKLGCSIIIINVGPLLAQPMQRWTVDKSPVRE